MVGFRRSFSGLLALCILLSTTAPCFADEAGGSSGDTHHCSGHVHHCDSAGQQTNLDLSSTTQNVNAGHLAASVPITIVDVSGNQTAVNATTALTAAQMVAAYQVAHTGAQSLLLGVDGAAVGGSFILGARLANHLSGLVIPEGVSVINKAADLNLTGNLTNAGMIYSVTSNPGVTTATISAANILNGGSGLISTVLPTANIGGIDFSQFSSLLNLNLVAVNNIINSGTIMSSGNLTMSAGGSIQNVLGGAGAALPVMQAMNNLNLQASQIINQGDLTAQMANINLATSSLVNQGTIQALAGNLNLTSVGTVENINVNGLNGLLEALNGNINFRDSLYTGIGNISLSGGDYLSKALNIYSGGGVVDIDAGKITGRLSISAEAAHVKADTPTLTLGNNCLLGDPTYYNTGNIDIDGPIVTNEDLAIVAGGNITATSTTASINTNGNDLLMIAGATINASGCVGCTPSNPLSGSPPSGGVAAGQSITVDLNTPLGGNIDLSMSEVGTGSSYIIDTSSGSGVGGAVTLIALANGDGTGHVNVYNSSNPNSINTSGDSPSPGGNVSITAGGIDDGNQALTVGDILTNGGSVTLSGSQAAGTATIGSAGNLISSTINAGAFTGGSIYATNIITDGIQQNFPGGPGGVAGDITITSGVGQIQVGTLSANGGAGVAGADGGFGGSGSDGGDGGSAGAITLQAYNGAIIANSTITAIGGQGGSGGNGGDGDGASNGGDGGRGGNGGTSGVISSTGLIQYIFQAITNDGGNGGAGGNGGGAGASPVGGNGGAGGNGGNASSIAILATSGFIADAASGGSVYSSGGSGGAGGLGSTLANGGAGGAGGNASSAITVSAPDANVIFHGVRAQGGAGGAAGQGNSNGGAGGQGGIGGSVLLISAGDTSGFGSGDYLLQGGAGGNGAGGNSNGGVGASGGQGGLLNVLSGGALGLSQVSVDGGAAGNGGGGTNAGSGGNGGRGGSILLSSVDIIDAGDGSNPLGDLTANGGVGGTGGDGILAPTTNGGNGGSGGFGGSIVITTLGGIDAGNIYANAGDGGVGGRGFGNSGVCGDGGSGNAGGSIAIGALDNVATLEVRANGGNGANSGGGGSVAGTPANGGSGSSGGYIQATIFGSFEHSYMSAIGGNGGQGNETSSAVGGGNGGAGGAGGGIFLLATNNINGFEVKVDGGNGGNGGSLHRLFGGSGGAGGNGGDAGYLSLLAGRDINELNLYAVGGAGGKCGEAATGGDGGNGGNGGLGGLTLATAQRDINTTTINALGGAPGLGGYSGGGTPGNDGTGLSGGVTLLQAVRQITIGDTSTPGSVQAGSITFITNYADISPVLTKVLPTAGIYTVQAGDLDNSGVSLTGIVFAVSSLTVVQNTTGTDLLIDQIGGSSDTQAYSIAAGGGSGQGTVSASSVDTLLTGSGTPPPAGFDVVVLSESNIATNTGVGTINLSSGTSAPGGQVIMVAGTASSVALGNYGTGTGIAPFLVTGGPSADGGSVNLAGGTAINVTTNANLVHVQALPAVSAPSVTPFQIYIGDIQTSSDAPLIAQMNALPGGSIVLAATGSIFTGALLGNGAPGADGDNAGAGGSGGLISVSTGGSTVIDKIAADGGAGGFGNGTDGTMGGMGGSGTLVVISATGGDVTVVNDPHSTGGLGGAGDRGGLGGNGGSLNVSSFGSITALDFNVLAGNGGAGGVAASSTYGGGGGQGGYIQLLAGSAVNVAQVFAAGGRGGDASSGAGGLGGVGGAVSVIATSTIDLLDISANGGRGGDGSYLGGGGNDGGAVNLAGSIITLSASGINVNGGDGSASGPFANGNAGYGGTVNINSVRVKISGGINANGGAAVTENSGGGSIDLLTTSTTVLLRVGSGSGNNYVNSSILANGQGSGSGGQITLAAAGGLSLEGGAYVQAESLGGRGDGGIIVVASGGPMTINGGSGISANGAQAANVFIGTTGDTVTIDSGAVISANGTDGLVEFGTVTVAPIKVLNNGDISAGGIVGFDNGPSGIIQISGAGTINAGQYVNVGNLNISTGDILPPFVTVSPFTGSFTLGNISIVQSSITGVLQVSGIAPSPSPTPSSGNSTPSFGLAQYLAFVRFLAELSQLENQNLLNEQIGTRLATDYTPIFIQDVGREIPLQGNVSIEQLASANGAIFSSAIFTQEQLDALMAQGIVFGPKSGGNFFDLNKGYVLFMPTSDIKVQTKEGIVLIPKGTIAWVMETGNDVAIYDLHDSLKSPLKVLVNNKELTLSPGTEVLLTRDGKAGFETLNPGGSIGTRNVIEKDMGQGIKAYVADFTISGGMTNVTVMRSLLKSNDPEHVKAAHKMLKNAAIISDLGGYKTPYKTKQ